MRPSWIHLPAVLLVAACAAPEPEASPAGEGLVPHGPFRMRITGTRAALDPDGKLDVAFETLLETADGRAIPPDRWFFEYARLAEPPLLTDVGESRQDETVGRGGGWSPKGYIFLNRLPPSARRVRRLVVDLPFVEILEGVSDRIELAKGERASRSIDALDCDFVVTERGLDVCRSASDEAFDRSQLRDHLRPGCFYGSYLRPIEHAWEISDARGRSFVPGPGFGTGGWMVDTYLPDPRAKGEVEYPLIVVWRVPRRWRATMQRFVFEDLVLPEPVPWPRPTEAPESK